MLAAVERLLGPGLLYGRLFAAAVGAVKTTLVFAIARRLLGLHPAAIVAALTLVCLELPIVIPSYTSTAIAWLLLAVVIQSTGPTPRRSLLAGACVGLAMWSEQDVGLAALLAAVLLPRPSLKARGELLLGVLIVGIVGLGLAWAGGFFGPMLTVLLREAPAVKGPRVWQWVFRVVPMAAFWAAFLVACRFRRPSPGVLRMALAGWIALHTVVCVALTVDGHPVLYGATYGLFTALFFAGHGLVIAKLAAREMTGARPLALASASLFAVAVLGGTGLPHILKALPMALIPLGCVWVDQRALRGLLGSLGIVSVLLGLGLRAEGSHYAFAGFPRLLDCDTRYAGVWIPAEDALSLRRLEHLLGEVGAAQPVPLDMISFPSPLPNVLLNVPTPLRRFTFYRETRPDLERRPSLLLVHDYQRRGPGELRPALARAFPGLVFATSVGPFHLYGAADGPLVSGLRSANTGGP